MAIDPSDTITSSGRRDDPDGSPTTPNGRRKPKTRAEADRSDDQPPRRNPGPEPGRGDATTGTAERVVADRTGQQPRAAGPRPAPAPANRPPRAKAKRVPRRKRRARKVHRVVRHVELWSVFKISVILHACGYFVVMIAGYLLWRAADRAGTIAGIEGFFEESGGYDGGFEIYGDVVFRVAAISGAVLTVAGIALSVLAALLFNLISDLTGGIRMTVIDEDLIVVPTKGRRRMTDLLPGGKQRQARREAARRRPGPKLGPAPADRPAGPPRAERSDAPARS